MSRSLSLPHEHGGYLTLLGGSVAAALLSPRPTVALAAAAAVIAAFFARGPIEKQLLDGTPARWDRYAFAVLALTVVAASTMAALRGGARALPAVAVPLAIVGAALSARRMRAHRSRPFELVAMAALGASTGCIALAGGTTWRVAAALAILLGVHAAAAVPLVRSELRPRERARAARDAGLALGLVAVGAALLAMLSPPAAIAFAPRIAQLAVRSFGRPTVLRPAWVGLRETAILATTVALAVCFI
jgi:hypothetical protein